MLCYTLSVVRKFIDNSGRRVTRVEAGKRSHYKNTKPKSAEKEIKMYQAMNKATEYIYEMRENGQDLGENIVEYLCDALNDLVKRKNAPKNMAVENYLKLKDKLKRRNMQIKDLKADKIERVNKLIRWCNRAIEAEVKLNNR